MAGSTLSHASARLRNSPSGSGSPRSRQKRVDAVLEIQGPVRMCRVCRKRLPKAELTRWAQRPEGLVEDNAGTFPGRGVYTCSDACTSKLIKPTTRTKPRKHYG